MRSPFEEEIPVRLPDYAGHEWLPVRLPKTVRDWSHGGGKSIFVDSGEVEDLASRLDELHREAAWSWPRRPHFFLSDLHGDADAFVASLVASGGARLKGPRWQDLELTESGKEGFFVIGGDCFDKGPSSLELLRSVRFLKSQGARVRILAGNHDVRVLLGMMSVGPLKDARNEHFFVRTGRKIIPLLREIWAEYLENQEDLRGVPDLPICRERLFPRDSWFEEFPRRAGGKIRPSQVERELEKMAKKVAEFEGQCHEYGLDLRQIYAAAETWKRLFLGRDSEFGWFYRHIRLCYRSGSLLFIHAGVDDRFAERLCREGVRGVNRCFRSALREFPCDFYYGSLCNGVRTKYREVDGPLTSEGVRQLREIGIAAIIHGHRNLQNGQRLSYRNSLINFECDTSLDRYTRSIEAIDGHGAAATIVDPAGHILGVSSDYEHAKVFHPEATRRRLRAGTETEAAYRS